jgi:hypothetical protein
MSFGLWLKEQTERNDPVGDLARDFKASGCRATTRAGVSRELKRGNASDWAWDAFEKATEQWLEATR